MAGRTRANSGAGEPTPSPATAAEDDVHRDIAGRTRASSGAGQPTPSPVTAAAAEDDGPPPEAEIAKLRGRWELASVLNFLNVFEEVIGNDLKLTAEEIETALVKPNTSIAKLHIILLKGTPPVSKQLDVSGAWVTALCKKLATWWPWVAEGEMPLKIAQGEEVQQYKELEPTSRLLILKALCEIRADRHDVVQFINDTLKNGSGISHFRKCRVGGDGNATSYWYDGNAVLGHRLYKEVGQIVSMTKFKNKSSKGPGENLLLWQTIATNLEEFELAMENFESSKHFEEVAISKTIFEEVLPAVKKFQKRKDRSLEKKEKQEQLFKSFRTHAAGMTRSCRSSRPVSYTFEEYDRAIDEAVEEEPLKKRKTVEKESSPDNPIGERNSVSNRERKSTITSVLEESVHGEFRKDSDPETQKDSNNNASVAEIDPSQSQESPSDEKESDYEYNEEEGDDSVDKKIISETESDDFGDRDYPQKQAETRRSQRLTHVSQCPVAQDKHNGARRRLRQRPTLNSAINVVVPDSDDDFV